MHIRKWFVWSICFLIVGQLCLVRAEDKESDRKKAAQEIQNDFNTARKTAILAIQSAKTEQDRKEAFTKLPKDEDYVPRVIKFVAADPKDEESFKMLVWTVQMIRPDTPATYDLLATHFAKDKKITPVCQALINFAPPAAKGFLKSVLDDNEDASTKGYACLALANLFNTEADKGQPEAAKEAERLCVRIEKEFGDVALGKRTLKDQAESMLRDIRTLSVGMKAPDVEGKDLADKGIKLSELQGKVVVLDIWATWCGPCRAMIPHEREMVERLKDKPFKLVSVSTDEKKETLEKFLENEKMPWDQWWDGMRGPVAKTFNVRFFPTIYVIDSKGVIRYKNIREKALEEAVNKLLDEAKVK